MAKLSQKNTLPSSSDGILLDLFTRAEGGFVSGSRIAKVLGVSRPAVWGRIKRLESEGFVFEAVRNRGYRLASAPRILHTASLESAFQARGLEMPFLFFTEIDSTNLEADRQLSHGRVAPFCVLSGAQTAGKGRLGRVWSSATAENLYLTVAFQPNAAPEVMAGFTVRAGVYLARAMREGCGALVCLKWPNDLVAENGDKLGGILTEAKMDADCVRSLIVGLGLNVGASPEGLDGRKATDLRTLADGEIGSLTEVAVLCAEAIGLAYEDAMAALEGDRGKDLPKLFERFDALGGKEVQARRGKQLVSGRAMGIDARGALRLQVDGGGDVSVEAGDVTLRTELGAVVG